MTRPDFQPDLPLLVTYVFHNSTRKCFYVSTVERDSSAEHHAGARYDQTIVWEYDWDNKKRGEMVHLTGDGPAFKQHSQIVDNLYRLGIPQTDEELERALDAVEPIPFKPGEIDHIVDHVVRGVAPPPFKGVKIDASETVTD